MNFSIDVNEVYANKDKVEKQTQALNEFFELHGITLPKALGILQTLTAELFKDCAYSFEEYEQFILQMIKLSKETWPNGLDNEETS